MKRILVLGDINSPHIQKWVGSLINRNFEIGVFSLSKSSTNWYYDLPNFELFDEHGFEKSEFYKNVFKKISFLKTIPSLRKTIKQFKPQILHAHYASSYGLLGALTKFHPYFISVWGSDVFDFPKQNFINKMVLKYSLSKADQILSTSDIMKKETALYTTKQISVTPFGINLSVFKPNEVQNKSESLVIGTVKTLESKYGIEYLIQAFKIVKERNPEIKLELLLVGGGYEETRYRQMITNLGLAEVTTITGRIPYNEVVKYHNRIDVYVAVSVLDSESFGVAVLEASACEKPVVVSNAGGLPEVVKDGVTGFIVQKKNIEVTAEAIEKLVLDKNLRVSFGSNGRKFVAEKYNWSENINQIITAYESVL